VSLTAEPPSEALEDTSEMKFIPRLLGEVSLCSGPWWTFERSRTTEAIHRQTTPAARRKMLAAALEVFQETPEALAQLSHDLRRWRLAEEAQEAMKLAKLHFSAHPAVKLEVAEVAIERREWQSALDARPLRCRRRRFRGLRATSVPPRCSSFSYLHSLISLGRFSVGAAVSKV